MFRLVAMLAVLAAHGAEESGAASIPLNQNLLTGQVVRLSGALYIRALPHVVSGDQVLLIFWEFL